MRKRLISTFWKYGRLHDETWMDLDGAALVEVTRRGRLSESSLRCSQKKRAVDGGQTFREIVRQQWNFGPA